MPAMHLYDQVVIFNDDRLNPGQRSKTGTSPSPAALQSVSFPMIYRQLKDALGSFTSDLSQILMNMPGPNHPVYFKTSAEAEACFRNIVDIHDVFSVQEMVLDKAGMESYVGSRFDSTPAVQRFVNVREIVRTSRQAKKYLKAECRDFKINFDSIENSEREVRPKDHAYNLMQLAHEHGLIQLDASSDSDEADGYSDEADQHSMESEE